MLSRSLITSACPGLVIILNIPPCLPFPLPPLPLLLLPPPPLPGPAVPISLPIFIFLPIFLVMAFKYLTGPDLRQDTPHTDRRDSQLIDFAKTLPNEKDS